MVKYGCKLHVRLNPQAVPYTVHSIKRRSISLYGNGVTLITARVIPRARRCLIPVHGRHKIDTDDSLLFKEQGAWELALAWKPFGVRATGASSMLCCTVKEQACCYFRRADQTLQALCLWLSPFSRTISSQPLTHTKKTSGALIDALMPAFIVHRPITRLSPHWIDEADISLMLAVLGFERVLTKTGPMCKSGSP